MTPVSHSRTGSTTDTKTTSGPSVGGRCGGRSSARPEPCDRFKRLLWHDRRVCNNCYRQVAETEERAYHNDLRTDADDVRKVRTYVREIAPEEYRNTTAESAHQDRPTEGMTGCCECGAIKSSTIDRPVSLRYALVLTSRAVSWYRERGVSVNEVAAITSAASLLRDPKRQHYQDAVISAALEGAINVKRRGEGDESAR